MIVHESADTALVWGLQQLREYGRRVPPVVDPLSIGSRFGTVGRPTTELAALVLMLKNPRARLVLHPARRTDPSFAVANAIATVAGIDDLAFYSAYNSVGGLLSEDGRTLPAAHGPRLAGGPPGGQLEAVKRRLREDPATRRATAVMYSSIDSSSSSRDVPCAVSVQFLARDGALDCIVCMRSQSALMVLPYDLFAFTFLQEVMAVELSLRLGQYWHMSGSYHLYNDEEELAAQVLAQAPPPPAQLPGMAGGGEALVNLRRVLDVEQVLRGRIAQQRPVSHADIAEAGAGLPKYWTDILGVLTVGLARRAGLPDSDVGVHLPEVYRTAFARQKPYRP